MLDSLKKLRRLIANLLGDNVPLEQAWDRVPPELMTPRELLVRRSSLIMLWGALVNLVAGIGVIALAVHAGNQDPALFLELQGCPAGGFPHQRGCGGAAAFRGHPGEYGHLAGAVCGDPGAGTVDRIHRLAIDRA